MLEISYFMLSERYIIKQLIRKDLSGGLYLAHDQHLDRPVSLRRFFTEEELLNSEAFNARFIELRESVGNLDHPGLLKIYDAGMDEDGPYIVSQPIEGELLSSKLKQTGALTIQETSSLLIQLLEIFEYLLDHGISHGSLSKYSIACPVTCGANYRLIDLGISTLISRDSPNSKLSEDEEKEDLRRLIQLCQQQLPKLQLTSASPEEQQLRKTLSDWCDNEKSLPKNATEALKALPHTSTTQTQVTRNRRIGKKTSIAAVSLLTLGSVFFIKHIAQGQSNLFTEASPPTEFTEPLVKRSKIPTPKPERTKHSIAKQDFTSPILDESGNLGKQKSHFYYNPTESGEIGFILEGRSTESGFIGVKNNALVFSGLSKHSNASKLRYQHKATATLQFHPVIFQPSKDYGCSVTLASLPKASNDANDEICVRLLISGKKRKVTLLDTRKKKSSQIAHETLHFDLPKGTTSAELFIDVMSYGPGDGYQIESVDFYQYKQIKEK